MAEIIQLGQPPIDITVKPSTRARRISIRVSGIDGRVSLTVPKRVGLRAAQDFLLEKEDWIRTHLAKQPEAAQVGLGSVIPVEGDMCEIVEGPSKAVRRIGDVIYVPKGAANTGRKLQAFLKNLARDRLSFASEHYAAELGRPFGKMSLRDTRSRWGSCSSEGNLMYSWRLILAPPEVLDYVAAHEVSHLAEMNHSTAFWAEVERLMPDYKAHRKWLRDHGAGLHRYQF